MDLSVEQGVAAIALDGLQTIISSPEFLSKCYQGFIESFDSPSFAEFRYDWFANLLHSEGRYQEQWESAVKLSQLYTENGLKTVVLKGFSIGQYYPCPNHRFCSDLDCYLISDSRPEMELYDNSTIQETGNRIVENIGNAVNRDYYRDSSFNFGSLHVENHRYCTYVKGSKRKKRYEVLLRHLMLAGDLRPINGTFLLSPPPMFLALHTVSHAFGHFCSEGLSLRHICDWAILMKQFSSEIDWEQWRVYCKEYGFLVFAETLSSVASKVCGVDIPFECPSNLELDDRFIADIFKYKSNITYSSSKRIRRQLIGKYIKRNWKYKLYSDTPMIIDLIQRGWGYIFEKNPKLTGIAII